MPRRSVSRVDAPCCYHVTHRCQERRFLMRFKQDRRRYLARLQEAAGTYAELTAPPARGRLIDRDRLLDCLECVTETQFREWYEGTMRLECARRGGGREPHWTEAAAVGGREWLAALASRLPVSWRTVEPVPRTAAKGTVAEAAGTYAPHLSTRRREGMLELLGR